MLFKAIPRFENIEKWQALNVPFEYNDFMHPAVLDDQRETERRIRCYNSLQRDRSQDTLHGPFYDIAIHSVDPKIRAISDSRIRRACDIGTELQAKAIVLHTNLIPNFYDADYRNHWVSANAGYIQGLLSDYQTLNVYMENMFDEEPDSLLKLAERIDHERFGICLDIGHCNLSKTDIGTWMDRCGPWIRQYHINDNDGKTDCHFAIGDGNMDWQSILPRMKKEVPVLIEVSGCDAFLKSRAFLFETNPEKSKTNKKIR